MSVDQEVRLLFNKLRERVEVSTDGGIYGDRSKALQDIDSLLATPSTQEAKYLLAPTGNLQELSIENGWGQEFNDISGKIDHLLGIS